MFGLPEGIEYRIMNSSVKAREFISACKNAIRQGINPEEIEAQLYEELGIDPDDFTYYDKERITKEVNEFWAEWEDE